MFLENRKYQSERFPLHSNEDLSNLIANLNSNACIFKRLNGIQSKQDNRKNAVYSRGIMQTRCFLRDNTFVQDLHLISFTTQSCEHHKHKYVVRYDFITFRVKRIDYSYLGVV